jgi:hypothetical protein
MVAHGHKLFITVGSGLEVIWSSSVRPLNPVHTIGGRQDRAAYARVDVARGQGHKQPMSKGDIREALVDSRVANNPAYSVGGGYDRTVGPHTHKLAATKGKLRNRWRRNWIAPGPGVQ